MNTTMAIARPNLRQHFALAAKANDPAWVLETIHRDHGLLTDVGFGRYQRYLFAFGPEANQAILADNDGTFSWAKSFALAEFLIGETSLLVSDGDEHRRRRRLVQPAFTVRRMEGHLDLIVTEIDRTLAGWKPGRSLDAFAELRSTVRRVAVRALFGREMGERADHIGDLLEPALVHLSRSPFSRRDLNLPWTAYGRSLRARREVDELLLAEIARRRRGDGPEDDGEWFDTLGALLEGTDGDEPLSDAELCDQIRGLIAAGYDSTSSAAAWLVHALGTNPDALAALRTQVSATIGDRAPTVESLRAMPLVDGVVRETLRLWPPASASLRHAVRDLELLGQPVAAGTMIVYSPYITHRMADVWEDPLVFDPHRWERGEPEPYAFVPFGGGYRKCIGFALATLELQVLAVRLAQGPSWRLENPDVRAGGTSNFAPRGGLPITVEA